MLCLRDALMWRARVCVDEVCSVDLLRCLLYSRDEQQLLCRLFGSMTVMRGNSPMTSDRCDPLAVAEGSVFVCVCVGGV